MLSIYKVYPPLSTENQVMIRHMENRVAIMSRNHKRKKEGEAKGLSTRSNSYSKFDFTLLASKAKRERACYLIDTFSYSPLNSFCIYPRSYTSADKLLSLLCKAAIMYRAWTKRNCYLGSYSSGL